MPSMLCPHSLTRKKKKNWGEKQLSSSSDSPGLKAAASTLWGGGAWPLPPGRLPGLALHPTPQPRWLSRQIPAAISLPAPCSSVLETPWSPRIDKDFSSQVESATSPSVCWVFPLRYYFKKASDEFACGAVFEEVWDDEVVLPMYEGRILGKVERID